MKKSLRTLVVLSIAASSILFATPSQAAVIGGVTITTTGNITGTSLSGNLFYYTSNYGSYSTSDRVVIDISGRKFEFANLSEARYTSVNYSGTNKIGVPATPVTNYDVTINMNMGYAYLSRGDIYVDGSPVLQSFYPAFANGVDFTTQNTWRGPLLQLNYKISTTNI